MAKKALRYGICAVAVGLLAAQFFQTPRTNPPADPSASFELVAKPSREVAGVVSRACGDCHSNRTVWPWYSHIAPVSWVTASDVMEGRSKLNFSQWNIYSPEMTRIKLGKICEEVKKGEMPPWYFLPMHPDAKVTPLEVSALCSASVAQTR
jgi:hypothetical protein